MTDTITKIKENYVLIEKTTITPDRIDKEGFDRETLDREKTKAQLGLAKMQARIAQLDLVQAEMDKPL